MDHALILLLIEQLMKAMLLDYQLLMALILVSIFGLMLVVMVKKITVNVVALALPLNAYPPLSFVGNNYYYESASWYNVDGIYFFNNTLWDGAGCVDRCDDTI